MNFALILFILVVVTGGLWLADRYVLRGKRAKNAPDPWWVEYGASLFPVIVVVFLLSSTAYVSATLLGGKKVVVSGMLVMQEAMALLKLGPSSCRTGALST